MSNTAARTTIDPDACFILNGESWIGPCSLEKVKAFVAAGSLQSGLVVRDAHGVVWNVRRAPAPVAEAPARVADEGMPTWIKFAGIGLGLFAVGVGLGALAEAVTEDPERRAIRRAAEAKAATGALVCAELPGWCRPRTFYGRRPDIEVLDDDGRTQHIIEFENEKSVTRSHARAQDRAFRRWSALSVDHEYTQVVVKGGRGGR